MYLPPLSANCYLRPIIYSQPSIMYPSMPESSVLSKDSVVDGRPILNQSWVNVRLLAGLVTRYFHSMYRSCKQETNNKCSFNIGTTAQTMAQH